MVGEGGGQRPPLPLLPFSKRRNSLITSGPFVVRSLKSSQTLFSFAFGWDYKHMHVESNPHWGWLIISVSRQKRRMKGLFSWLCDVPLLWSSSACWSEWMSLGRLTLCLLTKTHCAHTVFDTVCAGDRRCRVILGQRANNCLYWEMCWVNGWGCTFAR